MQATDAYNAGMQYTIRNIPMHLDQALRRKAKKQGRSLNEVAIEALLIGAGVATDGQPVKRRWLDDIAGTWVEDPAFNQAMKEQDQIHPDDWK